MVFGYGHLPIFASVAAVGAALAAGVDVVQGEAHVEAPVVSWLLAASLAITLLSLAVLHTVMDSQARASLVPAAVTSAAFLVIAALGLPMG